MHVIRCISPSDGSVYAEREATGAEAAERMVDVDPTMDLMRDPGLCWTGVDETGRGGSLSAIGLHNLTRPKPHHLEKASA